FNPREIAFHNESTQYAVVVYFCEYGKNVTKTGVGNPHFLSVQDVVFTVVAQGCFCFSGISVGTGTRLGEAICSCPFAGGKFRDVLLFLLLVTKIKDGHGADSRMARVGYRE